MGNVEGEIPRAALKHAKLLFRAIRGEIQLAHSAPLPNQQHLVLTFAPATIVPHTSRVFSATSWISMHAGHSMYHRNTTGWKSSSWPDPDCTGQRRLEVGQQQQSMCTKSRCPTTPLRIRMMYRSDPTRSCARDRVRPLVLSWTKGMKPLRRCCTSTLAVETDAFGMCYTSISPFPYFYGTGQMESVSWYTTTKCLDVGGWKRSEQAVHLAIPPRSRPGYRMTSSCFYIGNLVFTTNSHHIGSHCLYSIGTGPTCHARF